MTNKNFKIKNGLSVNGDITASGTLVSTIQINTQTFSNTPAAYTLVASDNGKLINFDIQGGNSDSAVLTLPNDSVLPVGSQVMIMSSLLGFKIVGDTGVTVVTSVNNTGSDIKIRTGYCGVTAIKFSANKWLIVGDTY